MIDVTVFRHLQTQASKNILKLILRDPTYEYLGYNCLNINDPDDVSSFTTEELLQIAQQGIAYVDRYAQYISPTQSRRADIKASQYMNTAREQIEVMMTRDTTLLNDFAAFPIFETCVQSKNKRRVVPGKIDRAWDKMCCAILSLMMSGECGTYEAARDVYRKRIRMQYYHIVQKQNSMQRKKKKRKLKRLLKQQEDLQIRIARIMQSNY